MQRASKKKGGTRIRKLTTISVAGKNGKYIPMWEWENPINLISDGFSFREGYIELEEASRTYEGNQVSVLKINFKQPDDGDGFKIYSLSFTAKNGNWILLSRERISTVINDISNDKIGYCVDTISSQYTHFNKPIKISNEMMFNLNSKMLLKLKSY